MKTTTIQCTISRDPRPVREASISSNGKSLKVKSAFLRTLAFTCVWFAVTVFGAFGQIIDILPGFNLVGDPLLSTPTSLGTLLPNPGGQLDGTLVYIYQCSGGFTIYTIDSSLPTGWGDANDTVAVLPPVINPGEGFIINNDTGVPYAWTITGTPGIANLPPTNYCGCGSWSLLCPQTTNADSTFQDVTGFVPQNGAQVSFKTPSNGVIIPDATFSNGSWSPNVPELTNGQAAFFYVPCTNANCLNVQCPTNMVLVSCTNLPVYYAPTVTDTCCSNWNVICYPASGSYFVPGTTNTVICSATDNCGNSNSCSFTVTVLSGTNCATNCFQVQCPTNKTVSCSGSWSYDLPTVNSCCGTNYSITVFGNDVVSGVGSCSINNTRTWLITDCSGQTYFCSQTVTVSPPTSYTITLYPGYNLIANQLNNPSGNSANVLFPNNTGSRDFDELLFYNCGGAYTTYYFDSSSPSGFDDQNFNPLPSAPTLSPGQGTFYVNNTGAPETVTFYGTPECPPPTSPLCPCGEQSLVSYTLDCPGTYQDITGVQPQQGVEVIRWNVSTQSYTVNTFSHGNWTGGTPVLNVGEAAFILIPCTNNCLQIQCWTNVVASSCTNVPVYYYPTLTDSCCSNWSIICTPASGHYFVPGTTNTVKCVATDSCGNSNNCSFTVTVLPGANCATNCFNIVCPPSKTVNCGSIWTFDSPLATSCCTNLLNTGTGTWTNVLVSPIGLATNGVCPRNITKTWWITDGCSNSTTCSQTVTVINTNPPTLVCASNLTVSGGQSWSFTPPTAGDACCSNLTIIVLSTVTNVTYNPCSINYTRTWQAIDCCSNTTTCSQTVSIISSGSCQIFNSGMSGANGNVPVAAGSPDPNFTLISEPVGAGTSCAVAGTIPGVWLPNSSSSQWVGPAYNSTNNPPGIFHYRLQFLLCCTNNAQLAGRMAADDVANLYLNGNSAGVINGYSSWTPVSITSGFVSGINILDIYVTNAITWTGFRAELTNCASGLAVNCPTNKTVECGTSWSFDQPTATSCCGGATVMFLNSITNGVCPKYITNSWFVYDNCGNTDVCSQAITVIDTTGPVITPQTNAQIVALNTNCELVIPYISVNATDNCTPLCSLVYTQWPPVGTIVSGTSAYVTVKVTDLCGNSSQTQVLVKGLNKRGLVVGWPNSLTTSNCLVPCVAGYLTVSDCSCSPSDVNITQLPPCNAPIGPGHSSITVTVRDCNGASASKVIPLIVTGDSFLNVLTNTGISTTGTLLPPGAVDLHYSLGPVPSPAPLGYIRPDAVVITNVWQWLGLDHKSQWIAPTTNGSPNNKLQNCASGFYTYTNQFVLPAGLNPATASISGQYAADDGVVAVYLNNSLTPNSIPVNSAAPGYQQWTRFTITGQFLGHPSVNTLRFVVTNSVIYSNSPTGLRVEYLAANACANCVPPAIILMTGSQTLPVGSTAVFNVKATGSLPFSYLWKFNGANINGVFGPSLTLHNIGYSSAGVYSVIIVNGCGSVTNTVRLSVVPQHPWTNAWWNFQSPSNVLAATVGPDLLLTGEDTATNFALGAGTTEDFGLPNPGGQIVNVIDINPQAAQTIMVPPVVPVGSNSLDSYTVILDLYEPSTSQGTASTLFQSQPGTGGVSLNLDAANFLHIAGMMDGTPFDIPASSPMPLDTWNRVALVVAGSQAGVGGNLSAYLNGLTSVTAFNCPCCTFNLSSLVAWTNGLPTVFSSVTNNSVTNAEFYVSSIQFHATAMSPQMIASIGSPDAGPAPGGDTSAPAQTPMLSSTWVNGTINLSWSGSSYVLQESTSLTGGMWTDASEPFAEATDNNGNVLTSVGITPEAGVQAKFYRLTFRP